MPKKTTPGVGHNSGDASPDPDSLNATAQSQLGSLVERIERLETEKAEIAEQIREVFAEAKGNGFDTKILRRLIARRRVDRAKLAEEEALLDLYESALGQSLAAHGLL